VTSYSPTDDEGTMNSEVDYTIYWRLQALSFDDVPDPRFYIPCSQHDAAHGWLSYGIQTRKGMPLLTGDIGCGKALLSRRLIGQPELRHRIARILQLNQQIAVRAHLGPFTGEETASYITARMGAATHRTDVFTKEAGAVIYEQSKGIGRLINALCDQCLFVGAIEHVSQIDDRLVQRVGQVI
jgi:type II secretory pathway predicted ATPase ExeA